VQRAVPGRLVDPSPGLRCGVERLLCAFVQSLRLLCRVADCRGAHMTGDRKSADEMEGDSALVLRVPAKLVLRNKVEEIVGRVS
jgi:hypothetical protein